MQLMLSFVFLVLAFATGANAYVFKNTLSHWLVSILSAFASIVSAWTAMYYATRFFLDPSKIILDALVFKLSMAFPNHASSEIVVFGPVWFLALALPLFVACIMARELRKMPRIKGTNEIPQSSTAAL